MSVFWALPFNLTQGTLIVAVVEAQNVVGYSKISPYNTAGAVVRTVPANITLPPINGTNTSET